LLARLVQKQIAELAHLQADELTRMGVKPTAHPRAAQRPRRAAPSRLRSLARALLMSPQRVAEVNPAWLDTNNGHSAHVRALIEWLGGMEPADPRSLGEAARGTPVETLVDELMADLPDKDETWDWNAEFEGALGQLKGDWQRRRLRELASRPLASLSAAERQELSELARS
jgi:DNA primase